MTDCAKLISILAENDIEFILIGGVAATVHGSARLTQDLDVLYRRSATNQTRIEEALAAYKPRLR